MTEWLRGKGRDSRSQSKLRLSGSLTRVVQEAMTDLDSVMRMVWELDSTVLLKSSSQTVIWLPQNLVRAEDSRSIAACPCQTFIKSYQSASLWPLQASMLALRRLLSARMMLLIRLLRWSHSDKQDKQSFSLTLVSAVAERRRAPMTSRRATSTLNQRLMFLHLFSFLMMDMMKGTSSFSLRAGGSFFLDSSLSCASRKDGGLMMLFSFWVNCEKSSSEHSISTYISDLEGSSSLMILWYTLRLMTSSLSCTSHLPCRLRTAMRSRLMISSSSSMFLPLILMSKDSLKLMMSELVLSSMMGLQFLQERRNTAICSPSYRLGSICPENSISISLLVQSRMNPGWKSRQQRFVFRNSTIILRCCSLISFGRNVSGVAPSIRGVFIRFQNCLLAPMMLANLAPSWMLILHMPVLEWASQKIRFLGFLASGSSCSSSISLSSTFFLRLPNALMKGMQMESTSTFTFFFHCLSYSLFPTLFCPSSQYTLYLLVIFLNSTLISSIRPNSFFSSGLQLETSPQNMIDLSASFSMRLRSLVSPVWQSQKLRGQTFLERSCWMTDSRVACPFISRMQQRMRKMKETVSDSSSLAMVLHITFMDSQCFLSFSCRISASSILMSRIFVISLLLSSTDSATFGSFVNSFRIMQIRNSYQISCSRIFSISLAPSSLSFLSIFSLLSFAFLSSSIFACLSDTLLASLQSLFLKALLPIVNQSLAWLLPSMSAARATALRRRQQARMSSHLQSGVRQSLRWCMKNISRFCQFFSMFHTRQASTLHLKMVVFLVVRPQTSRLCSRYLQNTQNTGMPSRYTGIGTELCLMCSAMVNIIQNMTVHIRNWLAALQRHVRMGNLNSSSNRGRTKMYEKRGMALGATAPTKARIGLRKQRSTRELGYDTQAQVLSSMGERLISINTNTQTLKQRKPMRAPPKAAPMLSPVVSSTAEEATAGCRNPKQRMKASIIGTLMAQCLQTEVLMDMSLWTQTNCRMIRTVVMSVGPMRPNTMTLCGRKAENSNHLTRLQMREVGRERAQQVCARVRKRRRKCRMGGTSKLRMHRLMVRAMRSIQSWRSLISELYGIRFIRRSDDASREQAPCRLLQRLRLDPRRRRPLHLLPVWPLHNLRSLDARDLPESSPGLVPHRDLLFRPVHFVYILIVHAGNHLLGGRSQFGSGQGGDLSPDIGIDLLVGTLDGHIPPSSCDHILGRSVDEGLRGVVRVHGEEVLLEREGRDGAHEQACNEECLIHQQFKISTCQPFQAAHYAANFALHLDRSFLPTGSHHSGVSKQGKRQKYESDRFMAPWASQRTGSSSPPHTS